MESLIHNVEIPNSQFRSELYYNSSQQSDEEIMSSNNRSYTKSRNSNNENNENNKSLQQEIEDLKEKIREMEEKQDILEAEKEGLVNQVGDLRVLLKRVAKEGESNLRRAQDRNKELQEKVCSFDCALQVSREYSRYFEELNEYWKQLE